MCIIHTIGLVVNDTMEVYWRTSGSAAAQGPRRNGLERGQLKPETFNFLGFTHICGKTRKGGGGLKAKARDQVRHDGHIAASGSPAT